MNFAEALEFLERRQETRWKLGLGRIESLLGALGDPQNAVPAVHVAGTNGKGSFCALLASVLTEAGYKTGLFTSPHLRSPRERIRLNGENISERDFARCLEAAKNAETEEASYFELITAAAFYFFREAGAQIIVVEAGMGGRLDATNTVARPLLCVVTSIDIEHARHLGNTHAAIAMEKGGILRPDVPFLSGARHPEAVAVLRRRAQSLGAKMIRPPRSLRVADVFWTEGKQEIVADGRRFRMGLIGEAAAGNAGLVLAAVEELKSGGFSIEEGAVSRGLDGVYWPGRFQILTYAGGRTLILDGAHNPSAMEAFARTWRQSPWRDDATMIFGVLRDKEYVGMIRSLAPLARRVIATRPNSHRALSAEEAAMHFRAAGHKDVLAAADAGKALSLWRKSGVPACVVAGSLYLVGEFYARCAEVPA